MAEIIKIPIDPARTATEQIKPILAAIQPKACLKHPDIMLALRFDASIQGALECWEESSRGLQRHEWRFHSYYERCQECEQCHIFKLPHGCARYDGQSKTVRMEPDIRAAVLFDEWEAQLKSPVCHRTSTPRTLQFMKATIQPSVPEYVVKPVFETCPACALEWAGVPPSLSRSNFNTFDAQTDSQGKIVGRCRAFAQNPTGFLFLFGNVGTGKTHLSIAVLGFLLSTGCSGRFATFAELLALHRASYGCDDDDEMALKMDKVRNVKILVLDEVRLGGGRDEEPLLFDLVSYRQGKYLPTVLTTNLALADIEPSLGSRSVDRIREASFASLGFNWGSHRSKVNKTYLARASLLR